MTSIPKWIPTPSLMTSSRKGNRGSKIVKSIIIPPGVTVTSHCSLLTHIVRLGLTYIYRLLIPTQSAYSQGSYAVQTVPQKRKRCVLILQRISGTKYNACAITSSVLGLTLILTSPFLAVRVKRFKYK